MLISQPILRPKEALKWSISYNREDWVAFDWVSLIYILRVTFRKPFS